MEEEILEEEILGPPTPTPKIEGNIIGQFIFSCEKDLSFCIGTSTAISETSSTSSLRFINAISPDNLIIIALLSFLCFLSFFEFLIKILKKEIIKIKIEKLNE